MKKRILVCVALLDIGLDDNLHHRILRDVTHRSDSVSPDVGIADYEMLHVGTTLQKNVCTGLPGGCSGFNNFRGLPAESCPREYFDLVSRFVLHFLQTDSTEIAYLPSARYRRFTVKGTLSLINHFSSGVSILKCDILNVIPQSGQVFISSFIESIFAINSASDKCNPKPLVEFSHE